MKKFILIFSVIFAFPVNTRADMYHGIDIDAVYESGDWNSKNYIKNIIDDNTLLLQYEQELKNCSQEQNNIYCYNDIAEKVLHHFYPDDINNNIKNYRHYVELTLAVYEILYCSDKYNDWAGTTCYQEKQAKSTNLVRQYIYDLIKRVKINIQEWEFMKDYKK